MNNIFLFLDDDAFREDKVRDPEIYYPIIDAHNILDIMKNHSIIVKFTTVEDAINYIEINGCPDFISFDNDLQQKLEGKDLAKWIIEKDLDSHSNFIPTNFQFFVHSQNTEAKKTIYSLLGQYLEHRDPPLNSPKIKI